MKINPKTGQAILEDGGETVARPKWMELQEKWLDAEYGEFSSTGFDFNTLDSNSGSLSAQQAYWMENQAKWVAFEGVHLEENDYREYLSALAENRKMYSVFFCAILIRYFLIGPPRKLVLPKTIREFHQTIIKALFSDDFSPDKESFIPVIRMINSIEGQLRLLGLNRIANYINKKNIYYRERYRSLPDTTKEMVLGETWAGPVGHLVTTAYYCAAQNARILPCDALVITDEAQPSNRYFHSLYMDQFQVSVRAIRPEEELERHGRQIFEKVDGVWASNFFINREIEKCLDPTSKGILLLSEEGDEALKNWKERHGIGGSCKLVTVHVRTAGYRPDAAKLTDRDWDIGTLVPALECLVERGYTIVRMGDSSMPPLPELANVYDYALSDDKSEILDIALVARAAFHIGSSSGFSLVPLAFSTPSLFLNWNPRASTTPWSVRSWTVFKPLYNLETGERVLDQETLQDLCFVVDDEVVRRKGFRRENLTESQVTAAVLKFEAHRLSKRNTEVNVKEQSPAMFESTSDGTLVQTDYIGHPLTEGGKELLRRP